MLREKPDHSMKKKGARLGQHFLTRPEIAGWVANAIPLSKNDTVLEIGPGHGILTQELLKRAGKVIAIEKDPVLTSELQQTFASEILHGTLTLLTEDVRNFDPSSYNILRTTRYTLVANIPYYITGLIIRTFLTTNHQPTAMALLVQKEVAERILAKDGKESLLSLSVKLYGTPSITSIVRAGAFSPPPKVDSAIVRIVDISRRRVEHDTQEKRFFDLLHQAFGGKRKQIGHTLRILNGETFATCGLDGTERPEAISLEKWLCLSKNSTPFIIERF